MKLCPYAIVTHSKTTESVYYQMSHGFVVRLSEHIGGYEKNRVSIVKSFNTDDFIVTMDNCPFPLIKDRNDVKCLIKALYEYHTITSLSKDFRSKKQKLELETICDWDKFWTRVCSMTANARFLTKAQKDVIKKYFSQEIRGEKMINIIKKIKPTTSVESIEELFNKATK